MEGIEAFIGFDRSLSYRWLSSWTASTAHFTWSGGVS